MDFMHRIELPDEIWSEIFLYLPLEDRKNVLLTCHRFYDLCNDFRFEMKEVISICMNINTDSQIQCLTETCRRIRHIKLNHVVAINHAIFPFFEKHGSNLRSLVIDKCEFVDEAFKSLIEYCDNLQSITLKFVDRTTDDKYMHNVLKDLKILKSLHIVRQNVVDLTLKISSVSNLEFLQFFDVFPSIKKLDLEIDVIETCDQSNTILLPIESDSLVLLFSHLYDRILTIGKRLEKLRLQFNNYPSNYAPFLMEMFGNIFQSELKNVRELSLNWICFHPDISILDPFLTFEQLTHFNLSFEQINCAFVSSLQIHTFLKLLVSRTHLLSLSVTGYSFLISCELFEAFLNSKLTTLNILVNRPRLKISVGFQSSSLENTFTPNFNLRYLKIDEGDSLVKCLFYTYFKTVEHLDFPEVHEGALSNIFVHQKRIYSLTLNNCKILPYFNRVFRELTFYQRWLEKEGTSIKRELDYLTYLRINEDRFSLTNFILSEFMFPNLKFLSINVHVKTEFDEEQLWRLLQKFTLLEYIKLELPVSTSYPKWLALFSGLTKLRHFCVVSNEVNIFNTSEYLELFNCRSSLRTVIHHEQYIMAKRAIYYFDVTSNKVMNISRKTQTVLRDFTLNVEKMCTPYYDQIVTDVNKLL